MFGIAVKQANGEYRVLRFPDGRPVPVDFERYSQWGWVRELRRIFYMRAYLWGGYTAGEVKYAQGTAQGTLREIEKDRPRGNPGLFQTLRENFHYYKHRFTGYSSEEIQGQMPANIAEACQQRNTLMDNSDLSQMDIRDVTQCIVVNLDYAPQNEGGFSKFMRKLCWGINETILLYPLKLIPQRPGHRQGERGQIFNYQYLIERIETLFVDGCRSLPYPSNRQQHQALPSSGDEKKTFAAVGGQENRRRDQQPISDPPPSSWTPHSDGLRTRGSVSTSNAPSPSGGPLLQPKQFAQTSTGVGRP